MASTGHGSQIDGENLRVLIERGTPPVILDVRSPAEFDAGHVPGAVNVPFWRLLIGRPDIPAPAHAALVVYCGYGPRARLAKTALAMRGFERVALLAGHMSGWRRAGLPEERRR